MKDIKKLLVPIDFSKPSMHAARYALELSQKINAQVQILHVIEFDAVTIYTATPVVPSSTLEASFKAGAQKLMKKFLKQLKPSMSVTSKIVFDYGATSNIICREAKRYGADWIVMSTHGWTGLKHLMMGSVAEKVVRTSPLPVLTVRAKGN